MGKKIKTDKPKKQIKTNTAPQGTQLLNERKLANAQLVSGIIQWSFTLIGAIVVFAGIGFLIHNLYHPDTESIIGVALEKCIVNDFHPEPVEALLYRVGLVVIPLCLLLFYYISTLPFFAKLSQNKGIAYSLVLLAVAGIAALGYYVFTQENPFYLDSVGVLYNERDRLAVTNYDFFFQNTFLETHLWQYLLLWVTFLLLFYLFAVKFIRGIGSKVYTIVSSIALLVFAGVVLTQIFNMMHFDLPLNWENQYDFNAVFYSATQVNAGSQLLADEFTNTYGCYPHFLQPFFNLFGFSVSHFTLAMSLLVVFTFLAILLFLYTTVQDKLLVLLCFASCVYFPYLLNRLVMNFDSIFAIFPIRTTPVAFLLVTVALFLIADKKQKKLFRQIVYFLGSALMAFGIIWNFEFGFVSYVAWLAFLCYYDFFTPEKKFNWKKILLHIGVWILSLVVAFAIYGFVQLAQYGQFPDFSLLTSTLFVFSAMGFFMLPMSLFHPWMLLVLVYMLGLLYSIRQLFKKDITPKAAAVFVISILGCGLFAYFQGRSHNWNFTVSLLPGVIVLTLLADELWALFKRSNNYILAPLYYLCLTCLLVSVISIGAASSELSKMANHVADKDVKAAYTKEKKYINEVNQFIGSCDITTDKVILLCSNKYQGLVLQDKRMCSAVNPGILDLFYKSDAERYVTTINDSAYDVFLGNNFYYPLLTDIRTALAREYEVVDCLYDTTTLVFAHLQKRDRFDLSQNIFKEESRTILHEYFGSDSTGFHRYCEAGTKGVSNVEIGTSFTVELLFRPDSIQFYEYPILCSNATDSSGFAIVKYGNHTEDKYFISLGRRGFDVTLASKQWHYLVVTVDDTFVTIYDNGETLENVMFPEKYKSSKAPLFIGNNNSLRYFSGVFKEISVTNRVKSAKEVKDTWSAVANSL